MSMTEVTIDSIHTSLITHSRIVLLKEIGTERYLPILIGADTMEAIHLQLQNVAVPRPMTHDLLKNVITTMSGKVSHVVVNALKQDTFHALINLDVNGKRLEIDSRTSDALALAVRTNAKIFVEEEVMEQAAIYREEGLDLGLDDDLDETLDDGSDENLEAFEDFIGSLDLDDLELE